MRTDATLRDQLAEWVHSALAIAFDEWIANADRTARNLLFQGANDFVLIDHGEAIPSGLAVDRPAAANILAQFAYAALTQDERRAAIDRVQRATAAFGRVDMATIETAALRRSWDPNAHLPECCRWLTDRLPHLPDLIAQRFGDRQHALDLRSSRGARP